MKWLLTTFVILVIFCLGGFLVYQDSVPFRRMTGNLHYIIADRLVTTGGNQSKNVGSRRTVYRLPNGTTNADQLTSNFVDSFQQVRGFVDLAAKTLNSAAQKRLYRRVIYDFALFADRNNLTYMIYGGSLIGSLRHHGFVPWDDDFDVWINYDDRPRIQKMFSDKALRGSTNLILNTSQGRRWKVYADVSGATKAGNHPFKWPYIDLCFYKDNGQDLYDIAESTRVKKTDVFPLTWRPFEGMMLRSPKCALRSVNSNINTKCCPNSWHHKDEHGLAGGSKCVDCTVLQSIFPFVNRTQIGPNVYKEVLIYRGQKMGSYRHIDCN